LLVVLVSALVASATALSLSATAGTTTKRIAASTLGIDFRTVLTAIRGSGGGGLPSATVKISAYERSGGQWKLVGTQIVGGPNSWFWNVVAGPGSVCRFSTSDRDPYPIEVRLLV